MSNVCREQSPTPGDTLELVLAPVFEIDARTGDEVNDRARDKDFVRFGEIADALGHVDRDSGEIVAAPFDLTAVQPGADIQPQRSDDFAYGRGAVDGSGRAIKGGQESVAGRLDLLTPEALELATHGVVVSVQDVPPAVVAEAGCLLCRANEVCEEHSSEHPVR